MNAKRIGFLAASIVLASAAMAMADSDRRSAYSYVRESEGQVTVLSELNGSVEARRNLPISAGDEVQTEDPARAEIAMADGNLVHVGGGTQVKFLSLHAQQGSDDDVSAVDLSEGSIILSVAGNDDRSVPRVDTEDATVYASLGSRVRVNADPRRGTAVVVRAGSVEVRTRAGSYTVRAGNYLTVAGDAEPEIARGTFSHDRFDGWAADRLAVSYDSPKSASSQYVGEDYSNDVAGLDGYGDWDYNSGSSSYVWRPRVEAGWSPYSSGSWYYTPAGLTWWSYDPWGWYPFHYGNWFFDAGWNSWCWSPGYVYSPAWVYWAYTPSYVGWCPVGYYGFYSPWWDNYYRNWSYPRAGLAFAINGRYSTRRVDMRGWNFTGSTNLGAGGRMPVVRGTRVVDRLGGQLAISSRPIVVNTRAGGNVRDSLRDFVREAPRVIERTSGADASRLEPVLARDSTLPRATVDAMHDRAVVAERGRLSGPGAMDVAPRGVPVIERGQGAVHIETTSRGDRSTGRTVITDRGASEPSIGRGRTTEAPDRGGRPEVRQPQSRSQERSDAGDAWRGRSGTEQPQKGRSVEAPRANRDTRDADMGRDTGRAPANEPSRQRSEAAPAESWRGGSSRTAPAPRSESRSESFDRGGKDWRSRPDVPPARRVIEGAVPGRRAPEPGNADTPQWREAPATRNPAPRDYAPRDSTPRDRGEAPATRNPAPRDYAPRDSAPRDRGEAHAPRPSAPRDAPRSIERAPAPHPPQAAPQHSAPPPRPAPAPPSRSGSPSGSFRSAPPPSSGRPGRP